MDEVSVLTETLNSTLQRLSRMTQAYEVEIANLTVEIVKLRSALEEIESATKVDEDKSVKATTVKS